MIPAEDKTALGNFTHDYVEFIRDNNLRLGISNLSNDIMMLNTYHRQAELALHYGEKYKEEVWIHNFSEYIPDYLLAQEHSLRVESLCIDEVTLLAEYDAAKNTDYCHTLKAYIENQLNAVQTAKALFIHHATMVYRLKRITELTGLNLSDSGRILLVMLSFKARGI